MQLLMQSRAQTGYATMGVITGDAGVGYKVHFSQTCDEDAPQLLTHVETTPPPEVDESVLSTIHTDLAEKRLLPEQHLVDAGFATSAKLIQTQVCYGVDLVGPTLKTHWYQAETGYDLTHFSIDWEAQTVTCPQGCISSRRNRRAPRLLNGSWSKRPEIEASTSPPVSH
jgi:hypothetical protein